MSAGIWKIGLAAGCVLVAADGKLVHALTLVRAAACRAARRTTHRKRRYVLCRRKQALGGHPLCFRAHSCLDEDLHAVGAIEA